MHGQQRFGGVMMMITLLMTSKVLSLTVLEMQVLNKAF